MSAAPQNHYQGKLGGWGFQAYYTTKIDFLEAFRLDSEFTAYEYSVGGDGVIDYKGDSSLPDWVIQQMIGIVNKRIAACYFQHIL